eukprot:8259019-Pyramimonas_sp.AAC.1
MGIGWVEELSTAELARCGHALGANPWRPRLRCGKGEGLCACACSRCVARREGMGEREAVAKAAGTNEGAGSIRHSRDRVTKLQESFN